MIMRAAINYKKENKIVAAYKLRGLVHIKLHNNSSSVAVQTMDAL